MNKFYSNIFYFLVSFWVLFLCVFSPKHLSSQIPPSDFICVENDTLRWTVPNISCGPFVSYDIYYSNNLAGPYTLLQSVNDPLQNDFFHMNANSANNTWYYYIENNFDCPGLSPLPSDTLDNRDPDFPPIDAVTVNNGLVEIFWTQSEAPETAGYIIYKKGSDGNFSPIDTIMPETTTYYLDNSSNPSDGSEEYTLLAIDGCGNTSIFNTAPQASIFSTVEIDPCTQSASINWNLYKNWTEGIEKHEIWVSESGSPLVAVDTLPASDTTYIYGGLDDATSYCFLVRTYRNNSDFYSESNEICLTTSIVQPNRNLTLQSVSFTPDDDIELIWFWDTQAEINTVNIRNSDSNSNYTNVQSMNPDFPLEERDTFYVMNHQGNNGKEFYQIQTIDDCDSSAISNYGATIFLSGESLEDQTNQLEWTPFDIENGTVLEYRIHKVTDVDEQVIAQVLPEELSYWDPNIENIYDSNACYFITAVGYVLMDNGVALQSFSRSNTICLEQFANIQFPNAFAPKGKNTIFKPLIAFPGLIAQYELRIFDRWGKLVFETNNPEEGWNGEFKGKPMPNGMYITTMRMTQSDGKEKQYEGPVMLIR